MLERDRDEPNPFDFVSANLSINNQNKQWSAVIGDYRPGYGQGLVLARYGRFYGMGTDIRLNERKDWKNTSFEETKYLRGLAVSAKKNIGHGTMFFSVRNQHASITDGKITKLDDTGLHYGNHELVKEHVAGLRINFEKRGLVQTGISGLVTSYSNPFMRRPGERHLYYPEGRTFRYLSADGNIYLGSRTILFYEHALMNDRETATLVGFQFGESRLRGTTVFRNYTPGYWSFRSGSLSAFGKTANERGIYTSAIYRLTGFNAGFSFDSARTLSRTYFEPMNVSREKLHIFTKNDRIGSLSLRTDYRKSKDSFSPFARESVRIRLENKRKRSDRKGWNSGVAWSRGGGNGGPYCETGGFILRKKARIQCNIFAFDIPSWAARYYTAKPYIPGNIGTYPVWGRGTGIETSVRYDNKLSSRWIWINSNRSRSKELLLQVESSF